MGEHTLQESLDELVAAIDSCQGISPANVRDTMFPGDFIAAIHNHLGNANQFMGSAGEAFNGVEQSLAYKSAQKELDSLDDRLFTACQTGLIDQAEYAKLAAKVRHLMSRLNDIVDPEYV